MRTKCQIEIAQMRPLPPFAGRESKEPFETWLQRFEQRAVKLNLSPEAKRYHLQENLKGEARRVYNDLVHFDSATYDQLVRALKEKYNHRGAFAANHYQWTHQILHFFNWSHLIVLNVIKKDVSN